MMAALTDNDLDAILAIQFTIAWAGEGRCQPRRLGWWETDLIDDAGGGDLFARLLPQTHAWASLEAVREAARRTDAKARARMADPDKMRTLFFLGFEVDEQLGDRSAALKRGSRPPQKRCRCRSRSPPTSPGSSKLAATRRCGLHGCPERPSVEGRGPTRPTRW